MKKEKTLLDVAEEGILLHRVAEAFEEIGEEAAWIGYSGEVGEWKPSKGLQKLAKEAAETGAEQAKMAAVWRWKEDKPKLVNLAAERKKDAEVYEKWVRQMEAGENLEILRDVNLKSLKLAAQGAKEAATRAEEKAKRPPSPPSLEERAKKRAARLSPSAADEYFNPLEELQDAVEALRGLSVGKCTRGTAPTILTEHICVRNKRGMKVCGNLPPFRAVAWRFAVFCKKCAVLAYCRENELWTCAILDVKEAAKVNSLRARLAKVKGDKEAYRKWKQKAKADRDRARVFEAYFLVYKAGMTVKETAEKMKLSLRTVESLLSKARKWAGAERRKGGRRGSVKADPLKGIEEAENEGSEARWKEEEADFYGTIDDDLDGAADENEEGF